MRRIVAILLSLSSLSAFAQVDKTVLPIAKYGFILHGTLGPGVGFEVGTGFCLDPDCRFVGTNYHVAEEIGKHVKIKGEPIVNRYFATSQKDEGAISNRLVMSLWRFRYNPARDLAVLELKQPLSKKKYHGLPYSLDDLKPKQEVDIWAYPMQTPGPKRRLLKFHAQFVGVSGEGMLAFRYEVVNGAYIVGGASGGIVVDGWSGKIVGVLSAVDSKYPVALAVPVQALADFVYKVQPYLGAEIPQDNARTSRRIRCISPVERQERTLTRNFPSAAER